MHFLMIRHATMGTAIAAAALLSAVDAPAAPHAQPLARGALHARAVMAFEQQQLARRDSIVKLAQAQLGTPYVFGGASPNRGFDCSGLVRWVFSSVSVVPPRTAAQQASIGSPVTEDGLRPGDLVTFGEDQHVSHVGIYVGQGRFVHASSVAGRVIESRLRRAPSREILPFAGARRVIVADAGQVTGGE